jgi:hypothetical protein
MEHTLLQNSRLTLINLIATIDYYREEDHEVEYVKDQKPNVRNTNGQTSGGHGMLLAIALLHSVLVVWRCAWCNIEII